MSSRLYNIQALRGVACLMVVWVHWSYLPDRFASRASAIELGRWFGSAGVDLFFVLSGFIITHVSAPRMGHRAAVPGFLIRRAWRIYPVYWAVTAAAVLLVGTTGAISVDWSSASPHWLVWLALLPTTEPNPVIGQSWTLVYEIQFYLVFGLLMCLPSRWAWRCLAVWGTGIVVIAAAGLTPRAAWAGHFVSPYVLEFLSGVGIARLLAHGRLGYWRAGLFLGLLLGVSATVLNWIYSEHGHPGLMADPRIRVLLFGSASALLVYAAVGAETGRPRRWLAPLLKTGDASYSIYLTHMMVNTGMVGLWMALADPRPGPTSWLLTTLFGSLVFGFGFYYLIERPSQELARRFGRKRAEPSGQPPRRRAIVPVRLGGLARRTGPV